MTQHMYWYRDRSNERMHVVFASSKSIAQWYVNASRTWIHDPVFVERRNRSADKYEEHTVLAHAADMTLKRTVDELRANGFSSEHLAPLEQLVARIR